jgi:hypothetical protein
MASTAILVAGKGCLFLAFCSLMVLKDSLFFTNII